MQARLTRTEEKRAKVASMVKEGKSLEEIKAATGDVTPPPAGGRGPGAASYVEVAYQELTKKG